MGAGSPALHVDEAMKQQISEEARIITSAAVPYEILAVNTAWCRRCGYEASEVVGRSSRGLLRGADTSREVLDILTAALRHNPPVSISVRLINYTKLREPFLNELEVEPCFVGRLLAHFRGTLRTPVVWLRGGGYETRERIERQAAREHAEAVGVAISRLLEHDLIFDAHKSQSRRRSSSAMMSYYPQPLTQTQPIPAPHHTPPPVYAHRTAAAAFPRRTRPPSGNPQHQPHAGPCA